jgi:Family of unknown function (DUF5763)
MVKACKATRKNGQPCQAPAGEDGYCFGHSPRLAEARRAGSSRGGRHKRSEARAARVMPEVLRPILHHLIAGMVAVEAGRMDPRVGATLASMATAVVRIYEAAVLEGEQRELAERVQALEREAG